MSVRFKYYLRGCGLGILVASLVFIVSLHAHGGAMSDAVSYTHLDVYKRQVESALSLDNG